MIGRFEPIGTAAAELRRPASRRLSIWVPSRRPAPRRARSGLPVARRPSASSDAARRPDLRPTTSARILVQLNVCSKEWIIRQYDHEVQGGSVVKPLVGIHNDGPGDAAVFTPVLGSLRGLAVGCGSIRATAISTRMRWRRLRLTKRCETSSRSAADPAPDRLARQFLLGQHRTSRSPGVAWCGRLQACHDVAIAYGTPFISGKDSLNNEYHCRRSAHCHSADVAHQRARTHLRRAPMRQHGFEGSRQSSHPNWADAKRDGRFTLSSCLWD